MTPPSFTASSRISGCRAHGTARSLRSRCLHPETTSPRAPSRSRSDVPGPPAWAVVGPYPGRAMASDTPRHPAAAIRPQQFDHAHALWQDRCTMRGALSALRQGRDRSAARSAVTDNGSYVAYTPLAPLEILHGVVPAAAQVPQRLVFDPGHVDRAQSPLRIERASVIA